MKKRTKLISLVSAFCLVLALGIFGVLAVSNLTFNMGGTVSFDAYGVNARIGDGTLSGATLSNADASSKMKGFDVTTDMSEDQIKAQAGYNSWSELGIVLGSTGEATLSFDVTNISDNPTEIVNIETTITSGNVEGKLTITATGLQQATTVEGNKTKTVVITFKAESTEVNLASTPFAISVKLSATTVEATPEATVSASASISKNETEKTMTISYPTIEDADEYIIPSYVKASNGDIYTVTELRPLGRIELEKLTIPATVQNWGRFVFDGATIDTLIFEGNYEDNFYYFDNYNDAVDISKIVLRGVVKDPLSDLDNLYIDSKEMVEYLSTDPEAWSNITNLYIHKSAASAYTGTALMGYGKIGDYILFNVNIAQNITFANYDETNKTVEVTAVSPSSGSTQIYVPATTTKDGVEYRVTSVSGIDTDNANEIYFYADCDSFVIEGDNRVDYYFYGNVKNITRQYNAGSYGCGNVYINNEEIAKNGTMLDSLIGSDDKGYAVYIHGDHVSLYNGSRDLSEVDRSGYAILW